MTTYSYNARNQVEAMENAFNELTTFVYVAKSAESGPPWRPRRGLANDVGRPVTQQNHNGTWVSYTYDDAGRLSQLVNLKSDATTLSSFAYSLDDVGNRIGVTEANGDVVTWSYDDAYQLTREQRDGANAYNITYSYDAVGNRLTKEEGGATTTYSYDAANQIETEETTAQVTTYAFDANGNTSVVNAGGNLTTYSWNIENMCTGIELPDSSLNTFTYDANLVRRSAEDSDGLANFINDGQNVLLETNSGGTTQVAYTLEPQVYGNLISQRRSGATNWHLFDGLGSTDRLTDANEDAAATYLHKAFGITSLLSGSSDNRYTWIGRLGYRWEPDAAEYDIRMRRLMSLSGRFSSRDSEADDANPYLYGDNSPLVYADPAGLQCIVLQYPKITTMDQMTVAPYWKKTKWYKRGAWFAAAHANVRIESKLCCEDTESAKLYKWHQWVSAVSTEGGKPDDELTTPPGRFCPDAPGGYRTCTGDPTAIDWNSPWPKFLPDEICWLEGGTDECPRKRGEVYHTWTWDRIGFGADDPARSNPSYNGGFFLVEASWPKSVFPSTLDAILISGIGRDAKEAREYSTLWHFSCGMGLKPHPWASVSGPPFWTPGPPIGIPTPRPGL